MTSKYTEDSIKRHAGLAGIRKRPTPYIGPTDNNGLWTIIREPLDNAVDQALAGRNKEVHLIFDKVANKYWVLDQGEGIPVGHRVFEDERGRKEKLSTFYVVTGLTHGGANFEGDTISRGCFVGDTLVHINGETVKISELYDLWKNSKRTFPCPSYDLKKHITNVGGRTASRVGGRTASRIQHAQITKETTDLVDVAFSDGSVVRSTRDHPYFISKFQGGAIQKIRADWLHPTDICVTLDGSIITVTKVTEIVLDAPVPVYDVEVFNTHTFFVGPGVLVSNTHGIGIKATNAMSSSFIVWTFRDGKWWAIEYASGKLVKDVYQTKPPRLPHGLKTTKGTVVCFTPELPMFQKGTKVNMKDVREWCTLTSYLVPGLKVKFTNAQGKTKTLQTKGPASYITEKLTELKATQLGKAFCHTSKEADIAIAFTTAEGVNVGAYTNGLLNAEGGEHMRALFDALVESLKPFRGKLSYTPTDLREGLLGLVNYKLCAPQFNNQPKDKLIDERVYTIAYPQFCKAWADFWAKNKTMAKEVVARAAELRDRTNDFLKDKKLIKNVKTAKASLNTKLAAVNGNTPLNERQLYIVEGDSAAGGLKRVRDRSYQAVFPLKGKPLNAMEAQKDAINKNLELASLLAALGLNPATGDVELQYGMIILVADPDPDGFHINSLLLGNIYKFAPHAFEEGRVFVLRAPLYLAKYKGKSYFGMTREDIYKQCGTDKVHTGYLKGWGEVSQEDLFVILDPKYQRLYKVVPNASVAENKKLVSLLGKDPTYRKQLFGIR